MNQGSNRIQSSSFYKSPSNFCPSNSLYSKPVILGIKNAAGNVRRFNAVIQEWERKEFGKILWVVWGPIEDQVTNASNLVADEKLDVMCDDCE